MLSKLVYYHSLQHQRVINAIGLYITRPSKHCVNEITKNTTGALHTTYADIKHCEFNFHFSDDINIEQHSFITASITSFFTELSSAFSSNASLHTVALAADAKLRSVLVSCVNIVASQSHRTCKAPLIARLHDEAGSTSWL